MNSMSGLDFAVPVFLLAYASRFGSKIRPLQLSRLTASVPDSVRRLPPRGRFGFNEPTQPKQKDRHCLSFCFGGEGGIFCELRRLPCDSIALSLPPFRKPVAVKTCPRHVFSRPSNPFDNKNKKSTNVLFCFWRRRRDLNPRASCPTYTLSRGASSPLEYFSIW